ncbi:MAG: carbohydrate ABC transporter permease, partial [Treponema socranskii subsp. buccale]
YITVPKELEEAARMDGLSLFGTFIKIMFPISLPVASSAAILAFLSVWNMYLEPLVFINSLEKFTLPLSLANFNDSYGLPQWHLQLAATTLSVLPIIAVYLLFQRKITNAMVNSGIK